MAQCLGALKKCDNAAIAILKMMDGRGEYRDICACAECWQEAIDRELIIVKTSPLLETEDQQTNSGP